MLSTVSALRTTHTSMIGGGGDRSTLEGMGSGGRNSPLGSGVNGSQGGKRVEIRRGMKKRH